MTLLNLLEPTGFCWKCGLPCEKDKLFCSPKHQWQYKKDQERQIRKGKRAGYGLAGSTH
jgi:predicted nucleic acid-binding Zn ribbon protein